MFSEAVDNVVKRAGRPDKLLEATVAVRNSMKQAHSRRYFAKDLQELLLMSTADPYVWNVPAYYRTMSTVRYGADMFPPNKQPGKAQSRYTQYWYQVSSSVVFVGAGVGTEIRLAYFTTNRKFKYYPVGERPAVWDDLNEVWTYLQPDGSYGPSLPTPEAEEAARAKVSNWLLAEWNDLVEEGGLASIFKQIGDERMRTHYSNFQSLLVTLDNAELVASLRH